MLKDDTILLGDYNKLVEKIAAADKCFQDMQDAGIIRQPE